MTGKITNRNVATIKDMESLRSFMAGLIRDLDRAFNVVETVVAESSSELHHETHEEGGVDELDITALGGYSGSGTKFLRDDAVFASVAGGGAHAVEHQDGGSDEIDVTGLSGVLADPQTAAAHTHVMADVVDAGALATLSSVDTTHLDNDAVTNAKLANIATARFKGRVTAGTGDPEDLTGTQATTLLDAFTSALKGLAPASGGGTTNFLRADGTWASTPVSPHAVEHQDGGSDEIDVTGLSGTLADPQTPTAHTHVGSDIVDVNGVFGLLADPQNPIISAGSLAFTDGDCLKRVTIADAAIGATDKIVVTVRRPNINDEDDTGYFYVANVVKVAAGSFDILVGCYGPGMDDTTELPPNETIQLYYLRAA